MMGRMSNRHLGVESNTSIKMYHHLRVEMAYKETTRRMPLKDTTLEKSF